MNETSITDILYPPISALESGFLKVDDTHELYWEVSGNPNGVPIVLLHGGPGAGADPMHRQFFDPKHYKIVIFDQRGSGRSKPLGELKDNGTDFLVKDIERLRTFLEIEKWHVFGGSWGSTLALAYAIKHPDQCLSLILRGIFLMRSLEIDWFINHMGTFFPESAKQFKEFIPENERDDLLNAYYTRLTTGDKEDQMKAGINWSAHEGACAHLAPRKPQNLGEYDWALARIEAHYFLHEKFTPEDYLLQNIDVIRHIPATIIQGRYDTICPIKTAHELKEAWPEADFVIVNKGGHSATDPGICKALVTAVEKVKDIKG